MPSKQIKTFAFELVSAFHFTTPKYTRQYHLVATTTTHRLTENRKYCFQNSNLLLWYKHKQTSIHISTPNVLHFHLHKVYKLKIQVKYVIYALVLVDWLYFSLSSCFYASTMVVICF